MLRSLAAGVAVREDGGPIFGVKISDLARFRLIWVAGLLFLEVGV